MAKKAKKTADKVIHGEEKSLNEQLKDARGDEKGGKVDAGSKDSSAAHPYTDEQKARDAQIKERVEYLKSQGITPDNEGMGDRSGGNKKVEQASLGKQYVGLVTLHSVHGQTHEKLSFRAEIPTPSGEDYLKHVMLNAHPHAVVDKEFTVDAENKTEPNYRSRYE